MLSDVEGTQLFSPKASVLKETCAFAAPRRQAQPLGGDEASNLWPKLNTAPGTLQGDGIGLRTAICQRSFDIFDLTKIGFKLNLRNLARNKFNCNLD